MTGAAEYLEAGEKGEGKGKGSVEGWQWEQQ
jgi:hypothetical protein